MTFTIIDMGFGPYTIDIESLDDLFALGHDVYGGRKMTIDWETMTITLE